MVISTDAEVSRSPGYIGLLKSKIPKINHEARCCG